MTIRIDPPHGQKKQAPVDDETGELVASVEVLKDYFVALVEEVRRRNRGKVQPGEN